MSENIAIILVAQQLRSSRIEIVTLYTPAIATGTGWDLASTSGLIRNAKDVLTASKCLWLGEKDV